MNSLKTTICGLLFLACHIVPAVYPPAAIVCTPLSDALITLGLVSAADNSKLTK